MDPRKKSTISAVNLAKKGDEQHIWATVYAKERKMPDANNGKNSKFDFTYNLKCFTKAKYIITGKIYNSEHVFIF